MKGTIAAACNCILGDADFAVHFVVDADARADNNDNLSLPIPSCVVLGSKRIAARARARIGIR